MAVTYTAQSPYQDPVFLAYLRTQGIKESDLVGEAAYRIAGLQRARARQLPIYDDQLKEGNERIAGDFEDRGFYRSGARLTAQARNTRDVGRERADFEARSADSMADISREAAMGIRDLRTGQAEEELDARHRVGLAGAEAGIR